MPSTEKIVAFVIVVLLILLSGCIEGVPQEDEFQKPVSELVKGFSYIFEEMGGPKKPDYDLNEMEKNIHKLINIEREKEGFDSMKLDERLSAIARKHSFDMVTNNYFSHEDLNGNDFLYRYREAGYTCPGFIYLGGENIFEHNIAKYVYVDNGEVSEYNTQEELEVSVVEGWMNSPGHKQNILRKGWTKEGIGVYIAEDGRVLITQNLC